MRLEHHTPLASLVTALGCLLIALFQLGLAVGAPWGSAAWGGGHAGTLPAGLRLASAVAVLIWAGAAWIVLMRGWNSAVKRNSRLVQTGAWILVAVLSAGVILNAASPSPWERFAWVPFNLALASFAFVVARSRADR